MGKVDIRLKIFFIALFIGLVPSLLFGYLLHKQATRLIMTQEQEKLKVIAEAAADTVELELSQQFALTKLKNLPNTAEKTRYLTNLLSPIGESFSDDAEQHGLSIYWHELNTLVVNSPQEHAGHWVGEPLRGGSDSLSVRVSNSGQPAYQVRDIRRGTYAMYSQPIVVEGNVVGAVNAMQSLEFLQQGYLTRLANYRSIVLALSLILALGGSIYLVFSLDKFSADILTGINRLKHGPGVKLPDAGGKIGWILAELEDMAVSLANNRFLTHIALETVDTGLIITDGAGSITFCNREAEKIFSAGRADIIGKRSSDFCQVAGGEHSGTLLDKTLQSGIEFNDEEVMIGRDENPMYYLCNTRLLTDWQGKTIGALCTLKNINSRKKLAELEGGGEIGRALREVAAGLAHEIKNPLTTVKGFLQMAVSDGENLPQENCKLLLKELERTLELLTQFRELNRNDQLCYAWLNADELVREMVSLLNNEARIKGVDINVFVAEEISVCWDEKRVKQVLLNLMRNAFEAMPSGGRLNISLLIEDDDTVRVDVADSGLGMNSDTIAKLGQPFFTTKEGGTGLGLTLTKSLVKQMKGYLEITSQPNKGSVFSVLLPRKID